MLSSLQMLTSVILEQPCKAGITKRVQTTLLCPPFTAEGVEAEWG